jgi:hypothetical protein
MNLTIMFTLIFGLVGIIVSIKRIDTLTKEYQKLLISLEKEE